MSKLVLRMESRLVVLAALALLIAQWGAISHVYSHDAGARPSTEQLTATGHVFCDGCLAYAPLLGAVGPSATLPIVEPQGRRTAARTVIVSLSSLPLLLAFRSRAPPPLR